MLLAIGIQTAEAVFVPFTGAVSTAGRPDHPATPDRRPPRPTPDDTLRIIY